MHTTVWSKPLFDVIAKSTPTPIGAMQDGAPRRSAVTVQLSEGVRSFQVLPYGGNERGRGAAEDVDVQCYLPPNVALQARAKDAVLFNFSGQAEAPRVITWQARS